MAAMDLELGGSGAPSVVLPIGVRQAKLVSPSRITSGAQDITASAVALPSKQAQRVLLTVPDTNAGSVYIGDKNVTSATGFPLPPPALAFSDPVEIHVSRLNQIFIIGTAADSIRWAVVS
jgi:hypothetical protein